MKQILIIILLILWGILQARRKAMRESERKRRLGQPPMRREEPPMPRDEPPMGRQESSMGRDVPPMGGEVPSLRRGPQPMRQAAGPVSAAENRLEEPPMYSRADELRQQADQFLQQFGRQPPSDLSSPAINDTATGDDEKVDEIVPAESEAMQDAYNDQATVRRRISFDKDSLRTFFVTREVLGPPRSQKPHRPGVKNK